MSKRPDIVDALQKASIEYPNPHDEVVVISVNLRDRIIAALQPATPTGGEALPEIKHWDLPVDLYPKRTEGDGDFWMAERGMKIRLEAQAPSGKWIAIFPAQLEHMINQRVPVRATEVPTEDERSAAIEECAAFIESGVGMADLIDQDDLDQQAKLLRKLATR